MVTVAGESIAAGDVLCDIETDKAVVSMEVDEDGIVAKIIVSHDSGHQSYSALIRIYILVTILYLPSVCLSPSPFAVTGCF